MKYNAFTQILASDKGDWTKKISCPLNKRWHDLQRLERSESYEDGYSQRDRKRHCPSCAKDVIDITDFDDNQVGALISIDPQACIHALRASPHITFEEEAPVNYKSEHAYSCTSNSVGVPVVHTARTVYGINAAAKDGYWPVIVEASASADIKQKLIVHQSAEGSIRISWDLRSIQGDETAAYWYNPYKSPLPIAAYLIPPGLEPGTKVYLTDVIEDVVGKSWNQGDSYRRESCFAIWDGEKMSILQQEDSFRLIG